MKKYLVICAGLCVALAFTSCKSSESAYKKAYEKAKAQEASRDNTSEDETPVVTPLVETPATNVTTDNYDNTPVRREDVTVVNGAGLKEAGGLRDVKTDVLHCCFLLRYVLVM